MGSGVRAVGVAKAMWSRGTFRPAGFSDDASTPMLVRWRLPTKGRSFVGVVRPKEVALQVLVGAGDLVIRFLRFDVRGVSRRMP